MNADLKNVEANTEAVATQEHPDFSIQALKEFAEAHHLPLNFETDFTSVSHEEKERWAARYLDFIQKCTPEEIEKLVKQFTVLDVRRPNTSTFRYLKDRISSGAAPVNVTAEDARLSAAETIDRLLGPKNSQTRKPRTSSRVELNESEGNSSQGTVVGVENGAAGPQAIVDMGGDDGEVVVPADELTQIEEENIPEWKKGDGWQMFEDLRRGAAREEINKQKSGLTGLSGQEMNYKDQRDLIEQKIIAIIKRENNYDTLSGEEQTRLDKEIRATVFEELAQKEQDAYIQALKDIRGETLGGKVKEIAQNVASSVAFKWYLSQNRFVRIGMTTALAVGIGYGVGTIAAAGVVSAAGARIARGALSFGGATLGRTIGANVKKWSIEDVNKKEQEEIEVIKNSDDSLEEKSKRLKEVREKADADRRSRAMKKSALTVGLGAGAGLLSGLAEHLVGGVHAVPENIPVKPQAAPVPAHEPEPVVVPQTETSVIREMPVERVYMDQIFDDPSVVKHIASPGDSQWRLLEKTLDHNDRFANLSNGSRAWLIDSLIRNKINPDPSQYGFHPNGNLFIGDKIDFHKIFDDKEEINYLLTKAENLSTVDIKNHLALHKQAEELVEKMEGTKTNIIEPPPEIKVEPSIPEANPLMAPPDLPPKPEIDPASIAKASVFGGVGMAGVAAINREKIQNELAAAKARKEELENQQAVGVALTNVMPINAPRQVLSFDGKKTFGFDAAVEMAHQKDINEIYKEKGWFGNVKVEGVKSKAWGWAQGLPASHVVQYATGDSARTKFPPNVVEALNKKPHNGMLDYVRYLVGEVKKINGETQSRDGEPLGDYLKRLGNQLFTFHSKQQQIAA